MLVGSERISSGRCEWSSIKASLLIISFTIRNSCGFLTPQQDVFFLHAIARCKLIHLIFGSCILTNEPSAVVCIWHVFVIAIGSNGGMVAREFVRAIAGVVEISVEGISQGHLCGYVSSLVGCVESL